MGTRLPHRALRTSAGLYDAFGLKRVYYSAFSPIPDSSAALPLMKPPLMREHRIYQADWLMRFYGFKLGEVVTPERPNLDLDIDPKLAWALRHREFFPVDLNRASKAALMKELITAVDQLLIAQDDPRLSVVVESGDRDRIRQFARKFLCDAQGLGQRVALRHQDVRDLSKTLDVRREVLPVVAHEARDLTERHGQVPQCRRELLALAVDDTKARQINRFIKDRGTKGVSSQTQGDQVRVSGKKRDDLQNLIAVLKAEDFGIPLQFKNFRD